ncbi:MAG TPA: hypothetical protein VGI12_13125 [Vicinamibacterales bacterium]
MLHVDAPSRFLSLAGSGAGAQNAPSAVTVQRFDETINGRAYRIEVSAIGTDNFRAQIARAPGGSRAMMPFYGRTPTEAVEHLSRWLSLNHARPPSQV